MGSCRTTDRATRMGDNSWAVNDGEASLMPSCAGGCGIYDFSGTVPNHVYYEYQWQLSKDDIKSMSLCWWDGASTQWSSDDDYKKLASPEDKNQASHKVSAMTRRVWSLAMQTLQLSSGPSMTRQTTISVSARLLLWLSLRVTRSKVIELLVSVQRSIPSQCMVNQCPERVYRTCCSSTLLHQIVYAVPR